MKTKRVIRLRRNSMLEQVWDFFVLTKVQTLFLSIVFIPLSLFAQSSDHDHSDSPGHIAEELWASIDQSLFREEISKAASIPKADITLFFEYVDSKLPGERREFFQKAGQGIITIANLENYLQERKQLYLQYYPLFLQEKNQFIQQRLNKVSGNSILAANGPCTNIDFENGTRSGWEGFTGDACTSPTPCGKDNGFSNSRHAITNTGMNDPFIPGLSPVAPGGNHSLRLENYQNGGDASGIRQTFLVTPTNNVFTYRYAVVLEDPGDHTDPERPYFKVRMYDENGDVIPCASYTAIAKPPIENFNFANSGGMDLYYRDWTTVSIPMIPYIGQNVTIEFIVSDCSRGGHLAYAYIDGQCSMLDPVTPKYICQGQNLTITATPGFAAYSWSGPGIVGPADQQSVVISEQGEYSVTFVPISDNPCPITIDFQVQEHCLPPPISEAFCEETKGSGSVSGLNLNDYVADILEYHSPPGEIISWHSGFPATSANSVSAVSDLTINDGDRYYAVISYANLGMIGGDTARLDFTVNPLPDIAFSDIPDVCAGVSSFQITGVTPVGGIFSGTNVSAGGIFDPLISGLFPIKYSYTDANGCIDSLSKSVLVKDPPEVEAGPGQSLCSGVSSVSLLGSVTNAVGGIWSGGSGTFSLNNTSLNASYTPTLAERNSGEVTLTLTTTGVAPCAPVSDEVIIELIHGPIVDAGEPQSLCETGPIFQLDASVANSSGALWSGGNGTFSPDATDPDATYTPSSSEITAGSVTLTYTASGNAPCASVSDQVVLAIIPAPAVEAGPAQTVCADVTTVSLAGSSSNAASVSWSGGGGSYSDVSDENVVYTPTTSEKSLSSITLTLTAEGNSPCLPVSDNVIINFVQPPSVDAGQDQSLCSDNAVFALDASSSHGVTLSWIGGSGSFSPDATDPDAMYTPSSTEVDAGTVTLTYAASGNAPCASVSDQVVLTIVPAPTVEAGPTQTVCAGVTTISLAGSSSNAASVSWSGGGNYSPDASDENAVYIPTISEKSLSSITLTLTASGNSPCLPVTDNVIINFVQPPSVDAGADQSLCSDNAVFNLGASSSHGGTLSWSGGSGSFSPDATDSDATYTPSSAEIDAGTVTLSYTASGNAPCISVSDEVVLTIVKAPIVDAGPVQTVCADVTTVSLAGSSANSAGVSWNGGGGNYSDVSDANTVYTPTTSEKSLSSITLTLTAAGNSPCLSVADHVIINFVQPPAVNAGTHQTQCEDNLMFSLNGSGTNAANFYWSGGSGSFSPGSGQAITEYTPSASEVEAGLAILTLTALANMPCQNTTDELQLTIAKMPEPHAGPDQPVCEGSVVNVSTAFMTGENYEWKNKSGTILGHGNSLSLSVLQDTTLIVYATSSEGCLSKDTVEVDAVPYPIVTVEDDSICPGESTELHGLITNLTAIQPYVISKEWKLNGETLLKNSDKLSVSSGGSYTFLVTAHTCSSSDNALIKINTVPIMDMPASERFCPELDGKIILTAPVGYSYYWMPGGSTGQSIDVFMPDKYVVTVTNQYNCSVSDETLVREACPPRLFLGNAFSPDGDGINDDYNVYGAHIGHYHMMVFNRWGEVIFESFDRTTFWDGYYKGEPMPIGVYPWIITYEGDTEEYRGPYKLEGSVTVVR